MGEIAYASNLSILEAETGEFQFQGHLGVQYETLPQEEEEKIQHSYKIKTMRHELQHPVSCSVEGSH